MLKALIEKPKDITFESQEKGEEVYYLLRRHPVTNLVWVLLSITLLLIPLIILLVFKDYFGILFEYIPSRIGITVILLWYSFVFFLSFRAFLLWYFNVYIITDKRVIDIDFSGLWNKRVSETQLDNIEDATYETSNFLHILFDYGDISVQTAAEKREFEFHSIPNPAIIHDKLTNLIEDYKHGRHK